MPRVKGGTTTHHRHKKILALAEKKGIKLQLSTEDAIINADIISIEELIFILMDNALKYTPDKGIVSLSVAREGRNAVMKVADSGEGISHRDINHIFDRFFRADRSRSKNRISGFGLGLPVAKRIVELHHGAIRVSSKIGKGSTFYVRLPLL